MRDVPTELDGVRVLIASRNEVFRQGLHSMLQGLAIVHEVFLWKDDTTVTIADSGAIDLVIISLSNADNRVREIAEQWSQGNTKILAVLPDHDGDLASQPVDLPVDGILLESELTMTSLEDALHRMRTGQVPMPASLARELLARLRGHRRKPTGRQFVLTPRESQTLSLLAAGLSNKQIARRFGVSEHTAKRSVAGVLAKLNCANRALAVAVAMREGLLDEHAVSRQAL
jgi:two-component system, NarL family, nitrate/nitrite response regulator NarL